MDAGHRAAFGAPPDRWQLQPPVGSRWDYKDRAGVLNGVRKARVKRIVKNDRTQGWDLRLESRDIDLSAVSVPGVPLSVTMSQVSGGDFQAQQHRTCKVTGEKLNCR